MNNTGWLALLKEQIIQTSYLEWIAVGFAVIQVLLAKSNKILTYPAGIISTILTAWILFTSMLYAESLLNIYYLIMSIYGWIYWKGGSNKKEIPVSYTTRKEWQITFMIVVAGGFLLYTLLTYFTPSDVPLWDSLVSSTAWAGMWLLARRKIENWILLNVSNLLAIPLLLHKQLPLFAALTVFLFIVAILGYFQWKKLAKDE